MAISPQNLFGGKAVFRIAAQTGGTFLAQKYVLVGLGQSDHLVVHRVYFVGHSLHQALQGHEVRIQRTYLELMIGKITVRLLYICFSVQLFVKSFNINFFEPLRDFKVTISKLLQLLLRHTTQRIIHMLHKPSL